MEEGRFLFLLFLTWTLVSPAQAWRQRLFELLPENQRAAKEKPASSSARAGGPAPPGVDCLFPPLLLLAWGLLVGLLAALVLYFIFFRGQGDASAGSDPDVLLDEALLRNISGALCIIRCRLHQIMKDRKKLQHFSSRSRSKSH